MPDADNTTPKPLISQSEQSYERVQHLKDSGTRFLKLLALRAASVAQVKWKRKRLALRVLLEQRWTAGRPPTATSTSPSPSASPSTPRSPASADPSQG